MSKPKILIQLDTDEQASVFDSVVAVDAGVQHLFRHYSVRPEQVRDLVFGAMFTRSVEDLKNTAIFVGGSDVSAGEAVLDEVRAAFFDPVRVSAMIDSNGANTTAAAAVLAVGKHVDVKQCRALVLAATGPVGSRAVQLLSREGAHVRAASRSHARAQDVCDSVSARLGAANLEPCQIDSDTSLAAALDNVEVVICAGAPGVQLLSTDARRAATSLRIAIDLNAVPPLGIEGIEATDKAASHDGVVCYGAIGVGGLKMKIHKAAIQQLFDSNDQILDAEGIYQIGAKM